MPLKTFSRSALTVYGYDLPFSVVFWAVLAKPREVLSLIENTISWFTKIARTLLQILKRFFFGQSAQKNCLEVFHVSGKNPEVPKQP